MYSAARLIALLTLMVAAQGIALPLLPHAIRLLAPPVSDFRIVEKAHLSDGRVRLTARVHKNRCVFKALRFAWQGPDGEVWRVGYVTEDQPEGVDPDRPPGVQSLGPWTVAAPPSEDARMLHISVRHRCGPVYVVTLLAAIDRRLP